MTIFEIGSKRISLIKKIPRLTTAPQLGASWNPSAVASLVLDADTIPQADASAVASWTSTGSNTSYQAVQATPADQPTLVKNVLGGRAVVRFNGSSTFLSVANVDTGGVSMSLVVLVSLSVAGTSPMTITYDNSSIVGWEMRGNGTAGTMEFVPEGGLIDGAISFVGSFHIFVGQYLTSTGKAYLYTDGSADGPAWTGTPGFPVNLTTPVMLGARTDGASAGSYYMTGDIACAMLVKGDLADADRQKIEGWMAYRWGLQANLPPGHPYKNSPP